jgi:hypothetical protein
MHPLRTLLPIAALALASACAGGPAAPPDAAVAGALIVQPRAPGASADVVRAVRNVLGPAAGVRYVRPMAGDAHLVHLTAPATRDQVPMLVERLRASAVFRSVEQDSMMKIQ